jgi:hypothetical protein
VPRQHWVSRRDQILVTTVERQTDKASTPRQRHCPPANFIHGNDVVSPPFQRANSSIEKFGCDFMRFQWLEARPTSRSNALEPKDDTGAAPVQPGATAEIGEFQLQVRQKSGIGRQCLAFQHEFERPMPVWRVLGPNSKQQLFLRPARTQLRPVSTFLRPACHYPLLTFLCKGRLK